MNPERWQQIKELFHAALERRGAERAAFLDAACAGDAEMRDEVESLIAAHERDGEFLGAPAARLVSGLLADNQAELETSTRVGFYRIVKTLGEGGMGKVYLAQDVRLGRQVALKLLASSFITDEQRVSRFEQEARAASALNHPNILTIHEIGVEAGVHFIATEFVEGVTLRQHFKAGEIKLQEVLEVAIQIAAALAAAHAAGIIHRDIKPENIMLRPDGYVKVLDFGLAKLVESGVPRMADFDSDSFPRLRVNTHPGMVMGTFAYMSPEQARGLETDARTDIWSLGVVLYEMLTGRAPFSGATNSDVMVSVLHREPPPLAQRVPGVPSELERIVMKALAKEREDRYQQTRDMLIDLRRLKQRMEFEAEMRRATLPEDVSARAPAGVVRRSVQVAPPAHAPAGQRKQVTILFADLYGFTELAETLDAEELSESMSALWNRIDACIMDCGGTVDKHMGDAVMALWGAQVVHEDDPERAIRAALQIQREVGEFVEQNFNEHGLARRASEGALVRVGINTGPVLLSAVGTKGEVSVAGAAVGIAHRLVQAAPPGNILISHDTYRHVRGVFDVRELELTSVKGTAEPVQTYVVERAKPRAFRLRTRGVEGVETRMIGRQRELERMRDALQTVIEDQELQVITVFGEAGLGKSRLMYELGNEVELLPERLLIFNGRASLATAGLPYALIRDVFSFRFGIQDSDSPVVAREKLERGMLEFFGDGEEARMRVHFIGHLIGLDFSASPHLAGILDDARQVRWRAFRYAAEFFAAAARKSPAILYLDDLHWADDGSLDFVDYLVRSCASVPLLILAFARPHLLERRPAWGEGQATHARLNLQPLTKRESRQLVEEILRHAQSIPHALRELVVGGAEGNPFYVEELIKMLIDQQVILPAADHWRVDASRLVEVRVPPTLTGVLQARLDALSAWEKTVLQRASVVGREFWDSALEQLSQAGEAWGASSETGDVRAALETLRRKELVYRREASTFAGTREYVFKHALLRDVTYENVLKRDRRRYHDQTARWLIAQSGERVDEYAAVIAEHFERAKATARAAEWYGRAGHQARASYAPETAIGFYRKALELLRLAESAAEEDAAALRPLRMKWSEGLGEVLTMQARYHEAFEAYTLMREVAEENGDHIAQARAWNGLTAVQEYEGDNHAALESARRAERLAGESGDSTAAKAELAVALKRQGLASHRLGDGAAVMKLGERILALGNEMGEGALAARASGLKLLGVAHEMAGRFSEANHCFEQSLTLLRQTGDRRNVGFMLNNLGVIAHLRGDYLRAVARYEEALAIFREIGERTWELPTLGNLGGAQIGLENYEAAEACLRQAVALAGPTGHFALSMINCYLAESLCGQGKTGEALAAGRKALELGQKTENQDYIGSAWRTLGLIAARARAALEIDGQTREATDCFAESLRVFTIMGAEAERARTLRDWARYAEAHADAPRGAAMWREAREIFARLRMDLEVERMQRREESSGPLR